VPGRAYAAGAAQGDGAFHGLRGRLSLEMIQFVEATRAQVVGSEERRQTTISRVRKAVESLWPRAQVKMYGSYETDFYLPSSDMDFVICLPAVHKNPAAARAGDLEGRNAINETWQQNLARKLRSESWVDIRSIKIIERTLIPVIKLCTKDRRDQVLHLDISFDGPQHNGLASVGLVHHIIEEFPVVKPIVLVMKQFLYNRGLLTAYTGGVSSYCLLLMVTRFVQEQPATWGDCGSLLMGFLDFMGNNFDPRNTGINVLSRCYFSRINVALHQEQQQQAAWMATRTGAVTRGGNMTRRHSFTGAGHLEAQHALPHTGTVAAACHPARLSHAPVATYAAHASYPVHNKPYTFDPLFVEDPLCPGNNVGRNSFRIFQVKRSMADAHRALKASLEWDISSTNIDDFYEGSAYPLLKCMLQNEDVFP